MLIQTEQFWSYLINEPDSITSRAKELLTFKQFDFDTRSYKNYYYWQEIFKWEDYKVIRFPTGLVKRLQKVLPVDTEKKIDLERKRYASQDVLKTAELIKEINPKFDIREYQMKACLIALNGFNSLIQSAVGSGKTSVISMVCKVLENDKILITNGNNNILQQIYERLLSFGINDIGWNPSAEPDYTKRIVLINCATSHSRLNSKDEKYMEFLKTVDTWIIDECHHFQSFTGFEPIFYTKADKLKRLIGFTATPFRKYDAPYENEQDFTTIALFGEPAFEYEMKDTIEDKNIAQPYSYFINYKNYVPKLPVGFEKDYFMQYRMGITYNKARNTAGLAMLKYLSEHKINTLACVNKIKNGQKLMETLAKQGIKCKFICGNQSGGLGNSIFEYIPNKRGTLKLIETTGVPEDIEKSFDEGYHIIFSTSVMQEGVDIQRFQAAVLFTGAKNFIGTTQMIGRATRQKKNGKNIAFVIDFKDIGGIPILADHYEIRKAAMKSNGIINIEKVQDFCKLIESINDEQEESNENKK